MPYLPLLAIALAAIPAATAYPVTATALNCRSGPGTSYESVKTYTLNTDVQVTCQTAGESIYGNAIWDKTSDGCYVTDYYIRTGTNGYVTEQCDSGDDNTGGDDNNSSNPGHAIVTSAQEELGLPYVWGGGGCNGPSGGGFDCSGLTQHAICQALDVEIPRTAQTQYNSDLGKKIPRAEAQEGDLLFWGKNGNCGSGVAHVAIFMRDGWMINAAKPGTPVREQAIWTGYGGLDLCPYAVRFW